MPGELSRSIFCALVCSCWRTGSRPSSFSHCCRYLPRSAACRSPAETGDRCASLGFGSSRKGALQPTFTNTQNNGSAPSAPQTSPFAMTAKWQTYIETKIFFIHLFLIIYRSACDGLVCKSAPHPSLSPGVLPALTLEPTDVLVAIFAAAKKNERATDSSVKAGRVPDAPLWKSSIKRQPCRGHLHLHQSGPDWHRPQKGRRAIFLPYPTPTPRTGRKSGL